MNKPLIQKIPAKRGRGWRCSCAAVTRYAPTPAEAYRLWHKAAMKLEPKTPRAPVEPYVGQVVPPSDFDLRQRRAFKLPETMVRQWERAQKAEPSIRGISTTVKRYEGFQGQQGGL